MRDIVAYHVRDVLAHLVSCQDRYAGEVIWIPQAVRMKARGIVLMTVERTVRIGMTYQSFLPFPSDVCQLITA
jgi:hypothetical protein